MWSAARTVSRQILPSDCVRLGTRWLTRGDAGLANPTLAAVISLKFKAYRTPHNKKRGDRMTVQSIANPKYPICERAQRMHDILLVSSFGLWAVLLGLSPVLAFHALAS